MSLVSTAYDAMIARVEALFPVTHGSYQRLSNPYDIEANPDIYLDMGWGVAFGPAVNTNRNLCSLVTTKRTVTVVLTRTNDATDNDDTGRDSVIKALLEDGRTVVNDFERGFRLADTDINCQFISDGGVETAGPDDSFYYVLRLQFEVELFDAP